MVVTRKATGSKDGSTSKRNKGPKYRTISAKATGKWKAIPHDLVESAMLIFGDVCAKFEGIEEAQDTLQMMKDMFRQRLTTLTVPDTKWTTRNGSAAQMNNLLAERDRLETMEEKLTEALEVETRRVEHLEERKEQLRMAIESHGESEIHPLLLNVEAT